MAVTQNLDLTRLTLGEVAKLEDLSGLSLDRIGDTDAPKGKLLAAMVFVSERRKGHAISWPECLNLETPDAMAMLGLDPDAIEGEEDTEAGETDTTPEGDAQGE